MPDQQRNNDSWSISHLLPVCHILCTNVGEDKDFHSFDYVFHLIFHLSSVINVYLDVPYASVCLCIDVLLVFPTHFDPCPHFLSCDWLSLQEVGNQDRSIPSFLHLSVRSLSFILLLSGGMWLLCCYRLTLGSEVGFYVTCSAGLGHTHSCSSV